MIPSIAGKRYESDMHELALTQSIVDIVAERARQEGMDAVTRITLELGLAAGIEPAALVFCFDVITSSTIAQGAELVIETIALQARCRSCACDFEPERLVAACPQCGSYASSLTRGREFRIKSFEGSPGIQSSTPLSPDPP